MNQDYKQLLSEVIKKQIVILGPDITLAKARNVPGLVVADDGTVTDISGNQQQITQQLIDQFVQLSGEIVRKTMEPLLTINSSQQTPAAQVPATPTPIPAQMSTTPTSQVEATLPDATTAQQAINASAAPVIPDPIGDPGIDSRLRGNDNGTVTPTVPSINQQPLAQDEKSVQ